MGNLKKKDTNELGFPGGSVVESPRANAGDTGDAHFWLGRIPWRRKWQINLFTKQKES